MAKKVNIINYINNLLYDYSSVVVPGLGAFLTQYAPARISEANGTVLPPVKTVQFNEKLNLNDGLLISHIARMEKITEAEASIYLSHFVDNIFDHFANGQSAVLEGIGTLSKTQQGIVFSPFAEVNFSADTFGLQPVELPPVEVDEGTIPTELTPPPVSTGPGLHTDVYEEPEDDTHVTAIETTEKRSLHEVLSSTGSNQNNVQPLATEAMPPQKKANYWWWLLPVLMLIAFIILVWQLPSGKKQYADTGTADTLAQQPTDTFASTTSATDTTLTGAGSGNAGGNTTGGNNTTETGSNATGNTTTSATNNGATGNVRGNAAATDGSEAGATASTTTGTSTTDSRGNATTTSGSATTNTNTTATTADNRGNAAETANEAPQGYYVVVASYDVQSKANKLALKLSTGSYKAYALPPDKGRYRVGYYCNTEATAKAEMARLKKSGYPGAWVLKK